MAQSNGVPAGGPGEGNDGYVNLNNGGKQYMLPNGTYLMDTSSGGGGAVATGYFLVLP